MSKNLSRIVLTGAECSGKTYLAKYLSNKFSIPWVSEKARNYLENKRTYQFHDLVEIAKLQEQSIQNLLAKHERVICDTDGLTIKLWMQIKYQKIDAQVDHLFKPNESLYLLCKPDIPFEEDPLRENPNNRDEIHLEYKDYLMANQLQFSIIQGDYEQRIQHAVQLMANLL